MYVTSTSKVFLLYSLVSLTSLHTVVCESYSSTEYLKREGHSTTRPQVKTLCDEGNCNKETQKLNAPITLASQNEPSQRVKVGTDDKSKEKNPKGLEKDANSKLEHGNSETVEKHSTDKSEGVTPTEAQTPIQKGSPSSSTKPAQNPRR